MTTNSIFKNGRADLNTPDPYHPGQRCKWQQFDDAQLLAMVRRRYDSPVLINSRADLIRLLERLEA